MVFYGIFMVFFQPLLSEPPLLGGMSFTFLRHPDIEYQLSGLAAVANAPGMIHQIFSQFFRAGHLPLNTF